MGAVLGLARRSRLLSNRLTGLEFALAWKTDVMWGYATFGKKCVWPLLYICTPFLYFNRAAWTSRNAIGS
jgi:hypothetical protein